MSQFRLNTSCSLTWSCGGPEGTVELRAAGSDFLRVSLVIVRLRSKVLSFIVLQQHFTWMKKYSRASKNVKRFVFCIVSFFSSTCDSDYRIISSLTFPVRNHKRQIYTCRKFKKKCVITAIKRLISDWTVQADVTQIEDELLQRHEKESKRRITAKGVPSGSFSFVLNSSTCLMSEKTNKLLSFCFLCWRGQIEK